MFGVKREKSLDYGIVPVWLIISMDPSMPNITTSSIVGGADNRS